MVLIQQEGSSHAAGNVNFLDGQLSRPDAAGSNPVSRSIFSISCRELSIREAGDLCNRSGSNPVGFKAVPPFRDKHQTDRETHQSGVR
jgi:hypothetical protein